MNNKFEDIMYLSGMTAQGCYDQMDEYQKESIQKFGELIINETLVAIMSIRDRSHSDRKHYYNAVKSHFGIE